jgi:hypothetical protein
LWSFINRSIENLSKAEASAFESFSILLLINGHKPAFERFSILLLINIEKLSKAEACGRLSTEV